MHGVGPVLVAGFVAASLCACDVSSVQQAPPQPDASAADEADAPSSAVKAISAQEVRDLLEQDAGIALVDVRTAGEYQEGHIPGALNLPVEAIGSERPAELPDQRATIVIYCRSGRRSAEAATRLVAMGYENIYDLGGINAWPYETVVGP